MKFPFSVSVIMPAFNEAENLSGIVNDCAQALSALTLKYEVIVVDDCSTDSTNEVLKKLQETYPCLRTIRNENNLGCHPSTLIGLKAAVSDVLVFLPSDGQVPPSNIQKFLSKINSCDLVSSYRRERKDNFLRHFASRFYNFIVRSFFGITLSDTHSAIAVKKDVVNKITDKVKSKSAFAGCEFILQALAHGFQVSEIEVDHLPRMKGKAKGANFRDAILTPINLVQLKWRLQKSTHL